CLEVNLLSLLFHFTSQIYWYLQNIKPIFITTVNIGEVKTGRPRFQNLISLCLLPAPLHFLQQLSFRLLSYLVH
ncbi:hypothetical protein, partial [Dyadobacter sp. LHD-138]|uniref:hypothetical protein n=1 Tax=Dyadobacter sp. LHD-138 TaxID=3071413 RepID=UPI0027E1AB4A